MVLLSTNLTLMAAEESKELTRAEKKAIKEAEDIARRKDIFGYWWMYDLGGLKPVGMMYLYEYKGKIYGRDVFTYYDIRKNGRTVVDAHNKPIDTFKFIPEKPYLSGMDMMWNLEWSDKKKRYINGYILDPRKKKPYFSEIWGKKSGLNMRGMIEILGNRLGGNVIWKRATEADLPVGVDPIVKPGEQLVPKIWISDKDAKSDVVIEDGEIDE